MRVLSLSSALSAAIVYAIGAASPAAARPTVLELFTSQGCSSCPPADALLTTMTGRRDVLPLAFHVTYWNSLGWRDPYSFAGATGRQAEYAAQLGGGSYTPELVVDGRAGVVGSDREAVLRTIAASSGHSDVSVGLTSHGARLRITLGDSSGRGRVLLVGFDPRHQTPVGRGENNGRVLTESNVVRSLTVIGAYDGRRQSLEVPRGAGSDMAVLVQAPDLHIIGAARL